MRNQASPAGPRAGQAVFFALVLGIAIFFAVMAWLEPALHDVWHFDHYAQTRSVPEYVRYMYFESDARIGNLFAYFVCATPIVHVIWAPLIVLLLLISMFAVALGRWPRPKDLHDSFLLLLLFALYFLATPRVGVMTFYRPFATMYLHAFAVLLAIVVVPYRFALAAAAPSRAAWRIPVMFVAGLIGGFTNEHTVPTAILAIVACLALLRRRGVRWAPWMLAGLLGLVLGFLLLFFAPAQDLRYDGLASQSTIPGRILDRGLGNLGLLVKLAVHARWMACVVVGALLVYRLRPGRTPLGAAPVRARLVEIAVLLGAALTVFCTMLASPLQGFRLMFASSELVLMAGFAGLALLGRDRVVRATLTVVASIIVIASCVTAVRIYATAHREFEQRVAILAAAPAGSVPSVPAYTQASGDWFYGDDFEDGPQRRKLLRRYWPQLGGVEYLSRAR